MDKHPLNQRIAMFTIGTIPWGGIVIQLFAAIAAFLLYLTQ